MLGLMKRLPTYRQMDFTLESTQKHLIEYRCHCILLLKLYDHKCHSIMCELKTGYIKKTVLEDTGEWNVPASRAAAQRFLTGRCRAASPAGPQFPRKQLTPSERQDSLVYDLHGLLNLILDHKRGEHPFFKNPFLVARRQAELVTPQYNLLVILELNKGSFRLIQKKSSSLTAGTSGSCT